jgi:hypothetical protein
MRHNAIIPRICASLHINIKMAGLIANGILSHVPHQANISPERDGRIVPKPFGREPRAPLARSVL